MRRYFAKVVDPNGHPSLKEEHVQIQDKPFASLEVGEEGIVQLRNRKTQELYKVTMIGLGYYDFEDEEDYEENDVLSVDVRPDKPHTHGEQIGDFVFYMFSDEVCRVEIGNASRYFGAMLDDG